MSRLLQRALCRPMSHEADSGSTQWATDKGLGILDWNPTPAESEEYVQKRAKMGDKTMIALLAKRAEDPASDKDDLGGE